MNRISGFLFILMSLTQLASAGVSCSSLLGESTIAGIGNLTPLHDGAKDILAPLDFNAEVSPTIVYPASSEGPTFPATVRSRSPRIEIHASKEKPRPRSVFTLAEHSFSEKIDEASLELVRAFLVTPDSFVAAKDATRKNKFSLGFRISQRYTLLVNYVAASLNTPRFVPASVSLLYPNGQEVVIAKDFLSRTSEPPRLEISRFELSEALPQGYDINLKIPLAIDGPLLQQFNLLASYFDYFPVETQKSSLQKIFASNSLKYIKTQLKLQYYRDVFVKVVVKEPFKIVFAVAAFTVVPIVLDRYFNDHTKVAQKHPPAASQAYTQGEGRLANDGTNQRTSLITERLNGIQIPASETKVIELLNDLKAEAIQLSQTNGTSTPDGAAPATPNAFEFASIPRTAFSREHLMWTFEKSDPSRPGVTNTYVVFAKEANSGGQNHHVVTYAIMKIDATKYAPLIAFINRTTQR
ncbi:MAG: hypothetical protein JNM39_06905 [Bdellovibrionaceae bacterium]|nr:hypothetical protein [Pseudobdellovibrionaceae bacterium]